jgi:hypothetical protein
MIFIIQTSIKEMKLNMPNDLKSKELPQGVKSSEIAAGNSNLLNQRSEITLSPSNFEYYQ